MQRRLVIISLLIALTTPVIGQAAPMREFVMACTYGVLAGTLVGAASLAFTEQPGDNMQKVARGASLGLYLGIALGAYVVYGVSDGEVEEPLEEPGLPPEEGEDDEYGFNFKLAPQVYMDRQGSGGGFIAQWNF